MKGNLWRTLTLKNKISRHMTAVSKNVYTDKLDDIVNEYNNTYHRTIKLKPVKVEDNTYIDYIKEINDYDPKFKVGDHVRVSKYKNILVEGYTSNWSEEAFVIKEVKNTVRWTYVINDLNGEEIMKKNWHEKVTFYEKELQNQVNKDFG